MKPIRTWILIANNENARIVENDGPGKGVFQPPGLAQNAETTKEYSDQPGRAFTSFNTTRSKMEGHQKHNETTEGFARNLVDSLVSHNNADRFDRLVLCAPPSMLGKMRDLLPKPLRERVVAELPKDLTHVPTDKLSEHLNRLIAT